jgi:hypothetical protein
MDEAQGGSSRLGSILKWMVLILLSPLWPFLMLLNTVGFQLLYVMAVRIANRTSRPLWVTLVGTYESGKKSLLREFATGFPAIPAIRGKNHRVKPGGSKWIYFDRKGFDYYEIAVRNAEGEYRELDVDPIPIGEIVYLQSDHQHVIDDLGSLVPVADDVLAAATERDTSWMPWVYFLVGSAVFVFYCWLLGKLRSQN